MLVINAGQLIDGSGSAPQRNMRVLVKNGRIADVVAMAETAVPEDAQVIDASRYCVMPGLIDTHVHLMSDGEDEGNLLSGLVNRTVELPGTLALKAYAFARRSLEAGFTALRDLHCFDFADISLRNAIQSGLLEGPHVFAGGFGLTATGGHMDHRNGLRPTVDLGRSFNNVIDTVDEARKAVRFLIKMGVDHIKINVGCAYRGHRRGRSQPLLFASEMRRDVIEAICAEAHVAGRRVAAHSLGSEGEKWAVLAGVDSLEHAHFVDDETLRLMAEHGTYLVPTMTHCVLNTQKIRRDVPAQEQTHNLILQAYDSMYRVIPRALEYGVRIAAGTDAGAPGVAHGRNALELELLTTAGMSPMEAIVAATSTAAELLDRAGEMGTLHKGRLADLLVVAGDPLADISLLQEKANIAMVVKEGKIVAHNLPFSRP